MAIAFACLHVSKSLTYPVVSEIWVRRGNEENREYRGCRENRIYRIRLTTNTDLGHYHPLTCSDLM